MKRYITLISFLTYLLIAGCATVPTLRVSKPWIRSLKSAEVIDPTKAIKIEASGSTSPLVGSEQLTSDILRSHLIRLITRRGFNIDDQSYFYLVKLTYRTERNDKMMISSSVSSTNSQAYALSTSTGATSGLGVSIARAIGLLASHSITVTSQTVDNTLSYTHTISIELLNRQGSMLWKGESTWDSQELNLINGIVPALQLILSDLPSDKTVQPEIPEVKNTHVNNYFRLECKDVWFTCPALPYRILFANKSPFEEFVLPSEIVNQNALAAYVDLIQTAEFALPHGDESDWKDPLDISIWKKVTLGGQYLLGPYKTPVNILIQLSGKEDGYYIDECKIANDKEYSEFSGRLIKWREILSDYYDVYKK